jgi:hypothetical protein
MTRHGRHRRLTAGHGGEHVCPDACTLPRPRILLSRDGDGPTAMAGQPRRFSPPINPAACPQSSAITASRCAEALRRAHERGGGSACEGRFARPVRAAVSHIVELWPEDTPVAPERDEL